MITMTEINQRIKADNDKLKLRIDTIKCFENNGFNYWINAMRELDNLDNAYCGHIAKGVKE